jgi:hypothetical protein
MLTEDRQAEIKSLLAVNAEARRNLSREDARLDEERDALAREYVVEHLLGTTTWSVGSDGETLVADQGLGVEVLQMFGSGWYHASFDLTAPRRDRYAYVADDVLSWLHDEKRLLGDVPVEKLLEEFMLARDTYSDVPLDEHYTVVARVDDSRLALQCADTDTLLAFVEKHNLTVRWDDAAKAVEEAEASVVAARERADRIRERMSRFLRSKVQGEEPPA